MKIHAGYEICGISGTIRSAIGANDDDQHNPKLNSEPPSNSCLAAIR